MGAITPQRRISKTRKRQRRSHFALEVPGMMVCPNCGEVKLAHTVCKSCGFYDGKLVKPIKLSAEEKAKLEEERVAAEKAAKKKTKKSSKKASGETVSEGEDK